MSNNWSHNNCGVAAETFSFLLTSHRWKVTVNFVNSQSDHVTNSHVNITAHQFKDSEVIILDSEQKWFHGGGKKAIYERIELPSLY